MKKMHTKVVLMLTVMAMLVSFTSCEWIDSLFGKDEVRDWRPNNIETNVSSDSLYVKKVENLSDDFIMGMDASCVPALEASGVAGDRMKTQSFGEDKPAVAGEDAASWRQNRRCVPVPMLLPRN